MSNIKDWSTVNSENNSAVPSGAPENQTFIADGNNIDRQIMADVRAQFEDLGWFNFGHVATNTGTSSFSVPGDYTSVYLVGRKVRIEDSTTLYGTITDVSYVNPNTLVTVDITGLTAAMNGQTVSVGLPLESVNLTEVINDIGELESGKMDLVSPAVDGNAMYTDGTGQAQDAGVKLATIATFDVDIAVPANNSQTTASLPAEIVSDGFTSVTCYFIATGAAGFAAATWIPVASTVGTSQNGWSFEVTGSDLKMNKGEGGTGIMDGAGNKIDLNSTNFTVKVRFEQIGNVP